MAQFDQYKSIAVMGGTFNPIHIGHLIAAEWVRQEYHVDRVLFMPAGRPPHKPDSDVLDKEYRYMMTMLATLSNPYFDVSRIEIDREGMTYTVDTIKELRQLISKETTLYFITGADAINEIFTWKQADEFLSMCHFIAVTRPGYDKSIILNHVEKVQKEYQSKISFLDIPSIAVSSSEIRKRLLMGNTIQYLVPETVYEYIHKYDLYTTQFDVHKVMKQLKKNLTPKRFRHTMSVIDTALSMAGQFGLDEKKIFTGALFHDCAKEIRDSEKISLCDAWDIKIDDIMRENPDLTHGFLGAAIAKRDFLITDEDILNAIRYHTTGRRTMSAIEKVLYLSDLIEPLRTDFDGLEEIRKLAFKNLDEAMAMAMRRTIDYLSHKKAVIHPLTTEAYEEYRKTIDS